MKKAIIVSILAGCSCVFAGEAVAKQETQIAVACHPEGCACKQCTCEKDKKMILVAGETAAQPADLKQKEEAAEKGATSAQSPMKNTHPKVALA